MANKSNESVLYRKLSASRYTQVENFSCPVCDEMVLPPIKAVCQNHHIACNLCLPHLQSCPLCRQKIKAGRCFELEYILQRLLVNSNSKSHDFCKFAPFGCSFVQQSAVNDLDKRQLSRHEKECLYRVVKMAADLNSWYDANYTRSLMASWKLG